jgi:hypothetical protein
MRKNEEIREKRLGTDKEIKGKYSIIPKQGLNGAIPDG